MINNKTESSRTKHEGLNRDKAVLIVAEVGYKSALKAELDHADPEIKARIMFAAEEVVDALQKEGLTID